MTPALPWHAGDHATAADWTAVVVAVRDGVPLVSSSTADGGLLPLPLDAVPDLADVGTAARWLRSCVEEVPRFGLKLSKPHDDAYLEAWVAIIDTRRDGQPWAAHDPDAVARAVTATREWLRVRGGER